MRARAQVSDLLTRRRKQMERKGWSLAEDGLQLSSRPESEESHWTVEPVRRSAKHLCLSTRWRSSSAQALIWSSRKCGQTTKHDTCTVSSSITRLSPFSHSCCAVRTRHRAPCAGEPSSAEQYIMVMCPLRHFRYRGLKDRRTRETKKRLPPSPAEQREAWPYGCVEGRRRDGAVLVQQSCPWSAEQAGVTSVLSLHDATTANLPMYHVSATEAAEKLALCKEAEKFPCSTNGSHTRWCVVLVRSKNVTSLELGDLARRLLRTPNLRQRNLQWFQAVLQEQLGRCHASRGLLHRAEEKYPALRR